MTSGSIKEYGEAMRKRYLPASKKEKTKLLGEFCTVTGYHRKAAVRLLRRPPGGGERRGRAPRYTLPVAQALRRLWEASDHLCSKRLAPFLPELIEAGEFIDDALYPYCQRYGISFTRGRPYKKNDQAYVEQKNWSVVRRLVGYHRYSTKAAYEQMELLYLLVSRYANFFQPIAKLVHKERVGAKVIKRYDVAKTPYQRLLETGVLEEAKRRSLEEQYQSQSPVHLKSQIDAALEKLWKLAQREEPIKAQITTTHGNILSEATS